MIDHAGIIHMNGRIYDSRLGRFLQADPNVQAPDNSQNLNRYSYVLNNPLSYTDPSGFFFKAIGKLVGKYWRQLVAVGIGIVTAGIASGAIWASLALNSAASFGVAVAGGALAGYVSTGTLNGALIGAFSAAAFYGVGSYFEGLSHQNGVSAAKATAEAGGGTLNIVGSYAANASLNSVQQIGKVIAHGVTGGVMSKLGGGRFAHGFASAGTTQAFAKSIGGIGNGNRSFGITAARVTSAAIVGGAASEISGGKFANGAVTGAFSRAFNDEFSHAISTLTRTVQRSVQVGDLDVREWEALFNEDIVDAELDIHQLALMTDLASNYLINDTEALRNAVNDFIGDEFKGRSLVGLSKLKISIVSKVISRATGTNLKTIEQLLRADRVISEVNSIEPTLKGVANGIINGDKEVLKVFNGD